MSLADTYLAELTEAIAAAERAVRNGDEWAAKGEIAAAMDALESLRLVARQAANSAIEAKVKSATADIARIERSIIALDPDRDSYVVGVEKNQQISSRLLEMQRLGQDTEDTGIATLGSLMHQREKLEDTDSSLERITEGVNKAKRVMVRMARRAFLNKLILAVMILALSLAIAAVIYFKWLGPFIRYLTPPPSPTPSPQPSPVSPPPPTPSVAPPNSTHV